MSDRPEQCPFCGSKYASVIIPVETEYQVQCGNCYASSSIESTAKKAIRAWNRRTPSDHIVDANKKVDDNPPLTQEELRGMEREKHTIDFIAEAVAEKGDRDHPRTNGGTERKKPVLFETAICSGYLKPVRDGGFIERRKPPEKFGAVWHSDDEDTEMECDGSGFIKTYFEHKKSVFSGVVVGFRDITLTAELCADTEYNQFDMEYVRIEKVPREVVNCAIVYYADNRKRYVPLDKINDSAVIGDNHIAY